MGWAVHHDSCISQRSTPNIPVSFRWLFVGGHSFHIGFCVSLAVFCLLLSNFVTYFDLRSGRASTCFSIYFLPIFRRNFD